MSRKSVQDKFNSQIKINVVTGCHEWQGYCDKDGYGRFRFGGKKQRSNRVMWLLIHGEIPDNLFVLHHCDNPKCVNIDHLWLGTHLDNMADRNKKNRQAHTVGNMNNSAKLTEKDVKEIRLLLRSGIFQETIAKEFNVTQQLISRIRNKKAWKHLE